LHAAAGLQETLVVMHYLYLAITFTGIVTLVFAYRARSRCAESATDPSCQKCLVDVRAASRSGKQPATEHQNPLRSKLEILRIASAPSTRLFYGRSSPFWIGSIFGSGQLWTASTPPSAAASAAEVAVHPSDNGADDSKRLVVTPALESPPPTTPPPRSEFATPIAPVLRRVSVKI